MLDSICEVFINDGAAEVVLKGLGVTAEISAVSVFFGTILGAALCFLRVGKIKVLRMFAQGYVSIVRGSPVIMLLMLMFYGIFANSGSSPVAVAIITFSMHTGAHVAELFRASLLATDKGQTEAARTLGFSKFDAFRFVTLPQLLRIARPVFQSTVVNLIQWTGVVGYVTITDLTRVINNIAARTMKPFTTIIGGMVIYLALSYLVYGIFYLTDERRRRGGEKA